MQPNAELAGSVARMYAMFETGEPSVVDAILSQSPDVHGFGTDPDEWWVSEALATAFRVQVPEMHAAGMRFRAGDIKAYSEGSTGWIADQPTLLLPNGAAVPMRLTAVWRLEAEAWKMVQFHLSIGVSNQEALGTQLTT